MAFSRSADVVLEFWRAFLRMQLFADNWKLPVYSLQLEASYLQLSFLACRLLLLSFFTYSWSFLLRVGAPLLTLRTLLLTMGQCV